MTAKRPVYRFVLRFLPPTRFNGASWGVCDRAGREMVWNEWGIVSYPATAEGSRQSAVELAELLNAGRVPSDG